jgi:hypothetical protein
MDGLAKNTWYSCSVCMLQKYYRCDNKLYKKTPPNNGGVFKISI